MELNFNEILLYDFIEGIPGNGVVYLSIYNDERFKDWTEKDWIKSKQNYFNLYPSPSISWLHDILKNKCNYDLEKTINYILKIHSNMKTL